MSRLLLSAAATALVLALTGPAARAQYPAVPRPAGAYTPVVSPYINLLNRNNPASIQYYGIVRPEVAFRNNLAGLQQDLTTLGAEMATGAESPNFPGTGHAVAFMNLSHYYGGPLGARGTGRGAGAANISFGVGPTPGAGAAAARPLTQGGR